MCRQLHEMGGGVADMHCCAPPTKNPALNSNGVQCKALILKTNLTCFTSHHMFTYPSSGFLEKKEYYASFLERQGGSLLLFVS